MKKLLLRQEEKFLHLYLQTCKVDLIVQFIVKKLNKEIITDSKANLLVNYIKNVIIHTH